jgi:hypothetical protein
MLLDELQKPKVIPTNSLYIVGQDYAISCGSIYYAVGTYVGGGFIELENSKEHLFLIPFIGSPGTLIYEL